VKRWERGGVFAYSSELDAWLGTEKSLPEDLRAGNLPAAKESELTASRSPGMPRPLAVLGVGSNGLPQHPNIMRELGLECNKDGMNGLEGAKSAL